MQHQVEVARLTREVSEATVRAGNPESQGKMVYSTAELLSELDAAAVAAADQLRGLPLPSWPAPADS